MAKGDDEMLPMHRVFTFDQMRRSVKNAKDIEALKRVALSLIDYLEAQQKTVNKMLRQQWLGSSDCETLDPS